MTFLQALKKVRPLIEGGRYPYICWAFEMLGAAEHRPRITAQLGRYVSYESWMFHHHPEDHERMRTIGRTAFAQGRLAWIDHMIAQEEALA